MKVINKNDKFNASHKGGTQIPKRCHYRTEGQADKGMDGRARPVMRLIMTAA